jgi:hypothetical protein
MLKHDFSRVRVYTGEQPAAAAAALGAKAFTTGWDVAFAAGRYRPDTPAGRELLAHELVHVAQQARGGSGSGAEARASQAGARAAQGQAVPPQAQGVAEPGIQCDGDEKKERLVGPLVPPLSAPPLSLQPLPPALPHMVPPFKLMKNAELLAPFAQHGMTPGMAGMNIVSDWGKAYQMFRSYLPEGLAATSANMFLSSAYSSSLALSQPNIFDRSERDYKAAHPDELRIPPIPLLSSGSLTTIYEFFTKKKNTDKFYF